MMVFLIELGLGLAYAWKKGALEGVMLRSNEDRMPTEEELARSPAWFPARSTASTSRRLQRSLNEKGFMVTTAEDLFTWARTGSLVVDDLRPRLLRG